jgi:hypothetical protein
MKTIKIKEEIEVFSGCKKIKKDVLTMVVWNK